LTSSSPYQSIAAIGGQIAGLITEHIDLAFRRIMPGPNVVIERRFVRLLTGEPHPFGNFALISDPADLQGVSAAIGPLLTCNAPAAVLFTEAVPFAVYEALIAAGFTAHGGMPAMAVEIDKLAETKLPAGYTFARVSGGAQRDAWADVFARGYGLPGPVGTAFAAGIDSDGTELRPDSELQYFWTLKGGQPVSTSLVYLRNGVAGIYGVATLPEERGKGLGAHMTAAPLRIARELGYRVGILQASEDGHPVYRRLGFADLGEVPLYLRVQA
jgi:GNAT superfamily N-acetyltransferase